LRAKIFEEEEKRKSKEQRQTLRLAGEWIVYNSYEEDMNVGYNLDDPNLSEMEDESESEDVDAIGNKTDDGTTAIETEVNRF